jgi:hypothetical protein
MKGVKIILIIVFVFVQTIYKNPSKIQSIEPVEEGFGKGLFVVISAEAMK